MYLTVVAWVPLIFLQLHDTVQATGSRRKCFHAVAAGLAYGMALLGGMPQMALSIPVLGAIYVAALFLAGEEFRAIGWQERLRHARWQLR